MEIYIKSSLLVLLWAISWVESVDVSCTKFSESVRFTIPCGDSENVPKMSQCRLKNLKIKSEDEVVNIDRAGYVAEKEIVDIRSDMAFIPNQIFQTFPKLMTLKYMGKKKALSIKQEYFKNGKFLENISIQKTSFSILNASVFSELENLEKLDLNSNEIQEINENALSDNTKITLINLGRNSINKIPGKLFHKLVNLQELYLCKNKIQKMEEESFSKNLNLKKIILRENAIEAIPGNLFKKLGKLEYVDLGKNKIQLISEGTFSQNKKLKIFNFAHNNISSIPENLFSNMKELELIDMNNNALLILDFKTSNNKNLRKLLFNVNPIKLIDLKNFDGKPNLELADLSNIDCVGTNVVFTKEENETKNEAEFREFKKRLGKCALKDPPVEAGIALEHLIIFVVVISVLAVGGITVYFPVAKFIKRYRETKSMNAKRVVLADETAIPAGLVKNWVDFTARKE